MTRTWEEAIAAIRARAARREAIATAVMAGIVDSRPWERIAAEACAAADALLAELDARRQAEEAQA